KSLLVAICLLIVVTSLGQSSNVQANDSLNRTIKQELKISQLKADSVSGIFKWASESIRSVMGISSLSKEEKLSRIKEIAAQRDLRMQALLSAEQIEKLKKVMAAHKQSIKANSRMQAGNNAGRSNE